MDVINYKEAGLRFVSNTELVRDSVVQCQYSKFVHPLASPY
jgi:hypothetical protein